MFAFFNTGAPKYLADQFDSSKSLGGYISGTPIPNATLHNVFGDISQMTRANARKNEWRAIAIKNTGVTTKTIVQAYFTLPVDVNNNPTNVCDFKIGFVSPSADSCGDLQSELLPSMYSTPYTITVVSANGVGNALQLPDVDPGEYLVLYIERNLQDSFRDALTTQQYVDIMNGDLALIKQEDIQLTLSWA